MRVIVTTLMLLMALILVQYEKGLHYGEGMFDTKYQESSSAE